MENNRLFGVFVLLALLAMLGFLAYNIHTANGEGAFAFTSDAIAKSEAPVDAKIAAVRMVDLDCAAINECDAIALEMGPGNFPGPIRGILLFDGYHIANGRLIRGDNGITAEFDTGPLRQFDGTVGVYLVILAPIE